MGNSHFWLTVEQFARLQPHLPRDTRGKPRVDDRRVISGMVHVLKRGGRSADARPVYTPRKTLYNRFVRGGAPRVCGKTYSRLWHQRVVHRPRVMIASPAVRAHRSASGGKEGSRLTVPRRENHQNPRLERSAREAARLPVDRRERGGQHRS